MDRKGIIVLVVCALLFFLWTYLVPWTRFYPPQPVPRATNQAGTTLASNFPPSDFSAATNAPAVAPQAPGVPEELLVTTNDDARYTFTSYGGGLKLTELMRFPETISCRGERPPGAERFASLNTLAPQPVLNLASFDALQGDGVFTLGRTEQGIRAEKKLTNGLSLIKEFRLSSNYVVNADVRLENHSGQPVALPAREWILGTATPMNAQDNGQFVRVTWYNGSSSQDVDQSWFANRTLGCFAGTPRAEYRASATNLVWVAAHNQFFTLATMFPTNTTPAELVIRQITLPPRHEQTNAVAAAELVTGSAWQFDKADFKDAPAFAGRLKAPQEPLSAYLAGRLSDETRRLLNSYPGGAPSEALLKQVVLDLNGILKSARLFQDNRDYFARLTLKPATRRLLEQNPAGAEQVRLNRLLLEEAYPAELRQSPTGYEVALSYRAAPLLPNQILAHSFAVYAGPKEYRIINQVGLQFNNNLEGVMGYSGFFGFFAKLLLLSMNGLHALGLSYASVIIAITVLIKLLFWPLTQASTRSMKRMQALQPQIKAIQEKYKDDPMKAQRKVMELWKEHKISPLGGCLPMFIQLPVFLGFYRMIQSAIELRGARFLWVCDLSRADTLFIIPGLGFIPFIGMPGVGLPINPLPLIMGVTMLWQARLSPPSPGMDPAQQKIMKYMPLMFLFILYNFSAGLTLYWTVQNLLTIAQTKLTRAKEEKSGGGQKPVASPPPKKKKD